MDKETADEIKRCFGVVAEGLRTDIRSVADRLATTKEEIDGLLAEISGELSEIKAMIRPIP